MSPPDGKQPHQVFKFVTVLLLEYHLIVPVQRGSVVLESRGGRITEPVRNGCCSVFPAWALWCGHQVKLRFECLPSKSETAQTSQGPSHPAIHR